MLSRQYSETDHEAHAGVVSGASDLASALIPHRPQACLFRDGTFAHMIGQV